MERLRPALFALATGVLAACATSDNTGTAPTVTALDQTISSTDPIAAGQGAAHRHVFELNGSPNVARAAGAGGGGTGISYHNGPVLQSGTKVVAIYWGTSPVYAGGPTPGTTGLGSADGSVIGHFLRNLGGSPYFNINSTYTNAAGAKIVNSVAYTGFWANNTNVPAVTASVTDAQMTAMLQAGFTSGALTYDPSTVYLIFTTGKTNLGGGFGSQYCAYHTNGAVTISGTAQKALYAAMPYDAAYASGCSGGITTSANGDLGADIEVNTLAHEIEETTTDMFGTAWYDRRGYENADKCAWTFGTTYTAANGMKANMNLGGKDFLVQQNWINSGSGGCVLKA